MTHNPSSSADARVTDLSRRGFLKAVAVTGGGFSLGILLDGCAHLGGTQVLGGAFHPNAWITITPLKMTFLLDRAEMGQGVMTSHAQMIAEELEVDPAALDVQAAPADRDAFGIQLTGGSTSVTGQFDVLRKAGATAREMLRSAAARRWGVPASEITARQGAMHHPKRGSLRYGELASEAAQEPIPDNVTLKDPSKWTVIGRSVTRVDAAGKVDGSAKFGMDVVVPGMLHAVVVRPPARLGTVSSVDAAAALGMPGVKAVHQIPQGVAVVADSTWRARKAARALETQWDNSAAVKVSSAAMADAYRKRLDQLGKEVTDRGDAREAMKKHKRQVSAVYEVPFLAHAPMEPLNCTAHVQADRCDIWVGTQAPSLAQETAVRLTGLAHHQVHVHNHVMGGGFGRRAMTDFVSEALELSQRMKAPVKVTWSREDDMRHGQYRPAALTRIEGAVDDAGNPVAWESRMVTQSLLGTLLNVVGAFAPEWIPRPMLSVAERTAAMLAAQGHVPDPLVVEGATPRYALANLRVELAPIEAGVPGLIWRSVGHSINAFSVESFLDELAHLGGQDPFELRRSLLAEHPRNKGVLELAAQKAGWGTPLPPGRFRGIAQHDCFDSYCAHVVEVSVDSGALRIHRVVTAVDCGTVVNPDQVAAQVEGGIMFALSAALHQKIEFEEGRVKQGNFHNYPLLRMNEAPDIEVHIVPSKEKPTGIGEISVPPTAAALANALFAATGQRFRRLPMAEDVATFLASKSPAPTQEP